MRIATIIMAILITTLALSARDAVAEDEIYRWVDKNGVPHFSDRPADHTRSEKVTVPPSKVGTVEPATQTQHNDSDQAAEPQPSYAQQIRDDRAEKRTGAKENAKIIAEACAQRRKIVSQLEPSPRGIIRYEDGTVSRMDDNERLEMLGEAKTYIAANCDK